MKKIYTVLIVFLMTSAMVAQSPQKLSYQAVVRDGNNALVTNSNIGVRIQILQDSEFGAAVYVETHSPETNSNGLMQLDIGTGAAVNGDFASIDWSAGPYFLKTEIDPDGADNYSMTTTAELLSVPYALYADKAKEVATTPSAFSVIGGTFQDFPADQTIPVDFTDHSSSGATFIEDNLFSLKNDEYTVPEDGIYFFGSKVTIDTRGVQPSSFFLYYSVNGNNVANHREYAFFDGVTVVHFNQSLKLKQGDKVSLSARSKANPTSSMGGNGTGLVLWTGFKVE